MGIIIAIRDIINKIPMEFFIIVGFAIGAIIGDIDARLMHKRIFKDRKDD